MTGLTVENTNEKLVLSIDKSNFSEEVLLDVMRIARLEYLIAKADFDESVLEIADEIKRDWWENNKAEIFRKAGL
jgi:hypothetical protein